MNNICLMPDKWFSSQYLTEVLGAARQRLSKNILRRVCRRHDIHYVKLIYGFDSNFVFLKYQQNVYCIAYIQLFLICLVAEQREFSSCLSTTYKPLANGQGARTISYTMIETTLPLMKQMFTTQYCFLQYTMFRRVDSKMFRRTALLLNISTWAKPFEIRIDMRNHNLI